MIGRLHDKFVVLPERNRQTREIVDQTWNACARSKQSRPPLAILQDEKKKVCWFPWTLLSQMLRVGEVLTNSRSLKVRKDIIDVVYCDLRAAITPYQQVIVELIVVIS